MITVNFNSTGALSLAYLRGDIELEMGCRTEKICHSCGKPLEKFKHIYRTNMIPFCNSTCRARYKYQHDILYREKRKTR